MTSRTFVTGATSGLGLGLARRRAGPGATLGLVARRVAELEGVASELRARGAIVHVFPLDVVDTAAMRAAAHTFLGRAGGVDVVFANAGIGIRDGVREGDAHEAARLLQVNVVGVANTILPFVPAMLEQRAGVLCAVGSFAGFRALPGRSVYSASKAAVKTFMDGLRMDLHGTGVHAMSVCPGYIHTPLTAEVPPMLFPIDVDSAVGAVEAAIGARRATAVFPWQMHVLRALLWRVPEALLRRLAPPPRRTTAP